MLNVFNSDAFSAVSMTRAINKVPYVPTRIRDLSLFSEEGIPTTSIALEYKAGVVSLIPNQSRTGTVAQNTSQKAKMIPIMTTHLPLEDTVLAEAIQNVREFGSNDALLGAAAAVNNKLVDMRRKHDATLEFHRLGAVKGNVLDSDGTTSILNLFTAFGLSQVTIFFDLDNANADMALKTAAVVREIDSKMGGETYEYIHAFVGSTFFDKLTTHASVKDLYKAQAGVALLNQDRSSGAQFKIGKVIYEEMSRTVGGNAQIAATEATFLPVGTPDLFRTYFAPANFVEAVNTIGKPFYARQEPLRYGRGIGIYTESNPLNICTRPETLVKGSAAAS